jgi:hypothetical protein
MIGTIASNSRTETVQKAARSFRLFQDKDASLVAVYTDGTDISELSELQCNAILTTAVPIHVEDTDVVADKKVAERFSEQCRTQYTADINGINYNQQAYLDAIIDYRKTTGKEPAQLTVHNGLQIGIWINNRRVDFKNGKLSANQIKVFRAAGVKLETSETVRMSTDEVIELLEHCHEHGIIVKVRMEKIMYKGNMVNPGKKLDFLRGKWSKLTQKQPQRLAAINVVKNEIDQAWMDQFVAWKRVAVDGVVCRKHTKEYKWQHRQRQAAKGNGGTLTLERRALLDAEEFKWSA